MPVLWSPVAHPLPQQQIGNVSLLPPASLVTLGASPATPTQGAL